jgi:hypothetical protein
VSAALLNVHGLRVRIEGWPEVTELVRADFAWFQRADDGGPAAVLIELEQRAPEYAALGDARAAFITPRNVVFQDAGRTIVDYFGRAVGILERQTGRLRVQGTDEHLVHEAAYQYLLSRAGAHLDAVGMPRLHALGLSGGQGGVAVLLPSGGGKSTLALSALRADESVRLLSDDSPLLDRNGRLHPFPLRIGINPTDAAELPSGAVRRVERMEFHPKLLLDVDEFSQRIEARPQPLAHLVLGRPSLGRSAELRQRRRRAAVGTLLREAVVGVGLYQGMEFVLQRGMRDTLALAPAGFARARSCAAGLARAQVWELTLGRDRDANWAALAPLLEAR